MHYVRPTHTSHDMMNVNAGWYFMIRNTECRERFPHHWLQRKPLVSDPGMPHGTCVTQVPWCISGSLTRGRGENVPGISGACTTHNFTYLIRGPTRQMLVVFRAISPTGRVRLCNWFHLRRLGPRRNHLPPVWWSTFRFWLFKNISWYVILLQWRGFVLFFIYFLS